MKKISKIIASFLLTLTLSAASFNLFAQAPGGVPDDPSISNSNGAVGHPVGAGASINGGRSILFLLALAYGGFKIIDSRRKKVTVVDSEE
jgi:hypothetical protein